MEISGSTRVLMILADPIAHVRTPQAINALAAACGSDTVMVPCHVAAEGLAALFAGLREMQSLDGLVVTAPHKTSAAALCDELDSAAALVGAVNAVRRTCDGRWIGGTFDGRGFVAGLLAAGHKVHDRSVFLAGAGGAASAIAFALAEAGAAEIAIHNRSTARAEDLAKRVGQGFPATRAFAAGEAPGNADIVVNGTSVGMRAGDPLPFRVDGLAPSTIVAEVIMQPAITPLLEAAGRQGCTVHPGKAMLDQQLSLIADFIGIGAAAPA